MTTMDAIARTLMPRISSVLDRKEHHQDGGGSSAAVARTTAVKNDVDWAVQTATEIAGLLGTVEASCKKASSNAHTPGTRYALCLLCELRTLLRAARRINPQGAQLAPLLKLANGLCMLRLNLFTIYMSNGTDRDEPTAVSYTSLARGVTRLLWSYEKMAASAGALEPKVVDAPRFEARLLERLFMCLAAIISLRWGESSLLLHEASKALRDWDQHLLSLGPTQAQLYDTQRNWLGRVHSTALAKAGVYFSSTLDSIGQQLNVDKRPSLDVDFAAQAASFAQRASCTLAVVADCSTGTMVNPLAWYRPPGTFHCLPQQQQQAPPLQGLKSFPALFCVPDHDGLHVHLPNVVSFLLNEPLLVGEWFHHFDSRANCTYFIWKLDPSIYCAIIYNDHRKKNAKKEAAEFIDSLTLKSLKSFWRK